MAVLVQMEDLYQSSKIGQTSKAVQKSIYKCDSGGKLVASRNYKVKYVTVGTCT